MATISDSLPVAARLTASQVLLFGPSATTGWGVEEDHSTREGKEIGRWLARI